MRAASDVGVPGDGDTLGVEVLCGDGFLQLVQLARLLQLLHQAFDGLLAPFLLLAVLLSAPSRSARTAGRLLPAQQALHHGRSERQDGGHVFGVSDERSDLERQMEARRMGRNRPNVPNWLLGRGSLG